MAVAAQTGSIELGERPQTLPISVQCRLPVQPPTHVESLSSTSLDDYVSRLFLQPDLLKIDVEGAARQTYWLEPQGHSGNIGLISVLNFITTCFDAAGAIPWDGAQTIDPVGL